MNKAPLAFRTISEVSETLDVPQHVLRFWEGKFPHIKPLKRAGGRRYYRPEDIELLRGIRALLYAEGYTIKGVQKVLRDSGARHVCEIGRYGVQRSARPPGREEPPAFRAAPLADQEDLDAVDIDSPDAGSELDADRQDDGVEAAAAAEEIDARRSKLEAALQELLRLRELLRAARPHKVDAA